MARCVTKIDVGKSSHARKLGTASHQNQRTCAGKREHLDQTSQPLFGIRSLEPCTKVHAPVPNRENGPNIIVHTISVHKLCSHQLTSMYHCLQCMAAHAIKIRYLKRVTWLTWQALSNRCCCKQIYNLELKPNCKPQIIWFWC